LPCAPQACCLGYATSHVKHRPHRPQIRKLFLIDDRWILLQFSLPRATTMAKRQRAWENPDEEPNSEQDSGIAAPKSLLSKSRLDGAAIPLSFGTAIPRSSPEVLAASLLQGTYFAAKTPPCAPPPRPPPPPRQELSPKKQAKTALPQQQQASSFLYKLEGNSHHDVLPLSWSSSFLLSLFSLPSIMLTLT
jgi:hypothetical protein